jgi:hypothetical protein
MNIKLDMIPHYDDRFDCIQNVLYSLLEKVVSFPELILFGNWNFKFKEDEIDENYIGGCLQSSKLNTISNCEEFFHLRFQPIQMGDGQLDAMVECL